MLVRNSMVNFQAMPPQNVKKAVVESVLKDGSDLTLEITKYTDKNQLKISNLLAVATKNGDVVKVKALHKKNGLPEHRIISFVQKIEESVKDGIQFLKEFTKAVE